MNLLKNLPIELEQYIYTFDGTYKPTKTEDAIYGIQLLNDIVIKARCFWYKKDPDNAAKYLFPFVDLLLSDDETDDETDDEIPNTGFSLWNQDVIQSTIIDNIYSE